MVDKTLISESFSVYNFDGKDITDVMSFLKEYGIVFEVLKILKEKGIGISDENLIDEFKLSEILKEITSLNKLESDEFARKIIYFMEYSNIIFEDQSKKYNFYLEQTSNTLTDEYIKIRSSIKLKNMGDLGKVIFEKYPLLFDILASCFLFGSYITFGRNRVSTIYKTLDILSLPQIEEAKKRKIPCSVFLKESKSNQMVVINMQNWGILINKYGHTTSERAHKWEERSRERMYMCVYFGWATKKEIDGRDCIILTEKGKKILEKYNQIREAIVSKMKLTEKEEVKFLFQEQSNRRGFLLIKDKKLFLQQLEEFNVENQIKKELIKNHNLIKSEIELLNDLIRESIIHFKITNPYHSTRVHQDFHSKPYLVLMKTLNEIGPCNLRELSCLILQFKDFRRLDVYEKLLKEIKKDRAVFDDLMKMNETALGRRWTGPENSVITIHGSLKNYILDFAQDFEIIEYKNNKYSLTKIGKSLLEKMEKNIRNIYNLSNKEVKEIIVTILRKENTDINNLQNEIDYSTFIKHKIDNLVFYKFNDSVFEVVNFVYPSKFNSWDFEGFRWNLEKAKKAVRWVISKKLKYDDEEIKNKISIKTFIDNGLLNVFIKYFSGYVSVAVMSSFPEKNFKGSDFRYPRIYLVLGLVFQKILKKIYLALGYSEGNDFLYDTSFRECHHQRKCRPDFQFKIRNNFNDKWVDAKYSNFTVFSSETLRYKEECNELEIVYFMGDKDLEIPLQGAKMISIETFMPKLKKLGRADLIQDLAILKKEIIPPGYKPTEYDRKVIEEELEEIEEISK